MNNSKKIFPIVQHCVRQFSRSAVANSSKEIVEEVPSKAFYKLRAKQEKFQIEDGKPVYIKGGLGDRVLYLITIGLVFAGTGLTGQLFYTLALK